MTGIMLNRGRLGLLSMSVDWARSRLIPLMAASVKNCNAKLKILLTLLCNLKQLVTVLATAGLSDTAAIFFFKENISSTPSAIGPHMDDTSREGNLW